MLRKKFFVFLLAFAVLLAGSLSALAQTQPVRGKIELKKADGTVTPMVGAVIEVYRTDVKAKLPSGKSDKKGQFVFAGMPLGSTMVFAVSGPGIKAEIVPGVKAGMEDLSITVYEGDGKALTEEEVRGALSTGPKQAQSSGESADQKKAREDYEKKLKEATDKNKKIEETNAIVNRTLEAGSKAYAEAAKLLDEGTKAVDSKNIELAVSKLSAARTTYGQAIANFDEGINADPDFEGSATVLNNNKALALRFRAFSAYRQGVVEPANKASLLEGAKLDFNGSIAASKRTVALIAKLDSTEGPKYDAAKYSALANIVEASRLMIATNADTSQTAEAVTYLDEYLAVEKDPALKVKNQIFVADALRLSGNSALAVPIYKKVLEAAPDNVDATGSLGLSLFDVGVSNADKVQMQDGLNIMQKFTEMAPDTHPLKASVKDAVAYLKDQEKLTPQKGAKTTTTTKKKP